MSRKRIESYGTIYHIIHGGITEIFKDSVNKIKILSCVGAAKEKYDFFFLGYCIMNDHYHLIIKTHNISISKIMQSINTSFGKYYNKKYKESPFKGRYKGIVIPEEELPKLISFVHNAPLHYDVVDSMEKYSYISHAFYKMNVDSIVNIDYLLDNLSSDRMTAIEEYSKLMSSFPNNYKELKKIYSIERPINKKNIKDLDMILREICPNEIDFQLIKKGSKKSYLMDYKRKYIQEAKNKGYSTKEIGENINISDRAVRKHIHH